MPLDRTKETAHYVIARSRPDKLGATKLNKSMWVADLLSYIERATTITGQSSYKKLQFGPVPNGIKAHLDELISEGKVFRREVPTIKGRRHEYIWLKEPDISVFLPEEIDILNRAIAYVCDNHTAESISELTHDPLWENTLMGAQIYVSAATINPVKAGPKQLEWALSQIEKRV